MFLTETFSFLNAIFLVFGLLHKMSAQQSYSRAVKSLEPVRVFHVDLEARPQILAYVSVGDLRSFLGGTLFKKEQE